MGRHYRETGVTQDGGKPSSREHRTHSNLFRYFTTLYHLLNSCATKCDAVGLLRKLNVGRRARKKTVASVKVQPTPTPVVKPSAKIEGSLSLRRTLQIRLSRVRYETTSSIVPCLKMLIILLGPSKQT